jgi:hypothetical protein
LYRLPCFLCCPQPILNRRQAAKLALNSSGVVVIKVFNKLRFKLFYTREILQIEQFALEVSEEVFHDGVVQAVPLTTHALQNSFGFKPILVCFHLILPALIGVEDQALKVFVCAKRFIQHVHRLCKVRMLTNVIGNHFVVM